MPNAQENYEKRLKVRQKCAKKSRYSFPAVVQYRKMFSNIMSWDTTGVSRRMKI